jgi:hypothetical protein
MTNPLLVVRTKNGSFRVTRASQAPVEWSDSQLHEFLVANGYTADDARACIGQAEVAHEIKIGLPE